jgi:hypothetical protein
MSHQFSSPILLLYLVFTIQPFFEWLMTEKQFGDVFKPKVSEHSTTVNQTTNMLYVLYAICYMLCAMCYCFGIMLVYVNAMTFAGGCAKCRDQSITDPTTSCCCRGCQEFSMIYHTLINRTHCNMM